MSHSTIWELSIKQTIGKIDLPAGFFEDLPELGYEILPMEDKHFAMYRELPLIHRDPFDRILVAQAIVEEIPMLSCDAEIKKYEVSCVW